MMTAHLKREMDQLKRSLFSLCGLVEEQVDAAVEALANRDADSARAVEEKDRQIDEFEIQVEEECLRILALYQPVAVDLRFIVCALKMNNDLERIGDLAVNIARKAVTLVRQEPIPLPPQLRTMGEECPKMLRNSVDALIRGDASLARDVLRRDAEVDSMKQQVRQWGEDTILRDPKRLTAVLAIMAASRNLERIADHATNIAEDVIYMIEGHIVRHHAGAMSAP